MSNRISPVFSISVFAILAAGVSSGYLIHNNHKVQKSIEQEDKVLAPPTPVPSVETPAPTITLETQVIETPKPKPVVRKLTIPKVAVAQALIKQDSPCEMVCEDSWQESQLGTHFKRCECKK